MNPWQDLLDQLTRRLRVDPELRLDVARELRCHLEDSAAEFRKAGQSDEEAAAGAARALGDPHDLTEQLWQANRGRIRIRGVCRWAAQVGLLPAAIVVIAALVLGATGRHPVDLNVETLTNMECPGTLSEEQRFILLGDAGADTPLEREKSIADRWPDHPVYYGNYVVRLMAGGQFYDESNHVRPERLDEMLAILDRGERIDPDNAFYNFLKAAWLVETASTLSEDTSRTYQTQDRQGKTRQHNCWKIEIRDPDTFRRGLDEFRRGLGKGECTGRSVEMTQVRLEVLGDPDRLNGWLLRVKLMASSLLPRLSHDHVLARAVSAHAIGLAESGSADEAVAAVQSVDLMAAKVGGTARTLIAILVAQAIRGEALAHAEQVYKQLGRANQAQQAREQRNEEVAFYNQVLDGPRTDAGDVPHMGMFWRVLTPSLPGYRPDFGPMRSAEQFVAAELALFVLLGCLVIAALVHALLALLSLIRRRGQDGPILLFVGWRRIGRICLLAVLLPLACYFFYAHVLTAADRAYGLNYTLGKTLLEYALLIAAALLLLDRLSYSAVRQRAEEIGMTVPAPLRLRDWPVTAGLGALVALAAVIYLIGWRLGPFKPASNSGGSVGSVPGLALAGLVVLFLGFYEVRELLGPLYRRPFAAFRRTLHRSVMPIFAAAVILIGVSCGWVLARGERSAVGRIKGPAAMNLTNEIERSDFRVLRDRLADRHKALMSKGE